MQQSAAELEALEAEASAPTPSEVASSPPAENQTVSATPDRSNRTEVVFTEEETPSFDEPDVKPSASAHKPTGRKNVFDDDDDDIFAEKPKKSLGAFDDP